jgi:hypothetical protein
MRDAGATEPGCLDDNLVAGFVAGSLADADRARVEREIDRCETCRRLVSAAMGARSTVSGAPAPTGPTIAPPSMPAQVGRYQVRRTLGHGAMGVVYAAWDPELEREVAVKLVRGQSAGGAARLAREARAMAQVRHPAVIVVHDAGVLDGEVFVVMELVAGGTLADWLATKPAWRDVIARARLAGAGLVAAHAVGLVHRDFKPANVLVGEDGRMIVADFGLARPAYAGERAATNPETDGDVAATAAGAIIGTPAYMAPEQHLGERAGPPADQFALAVTLYEGLYGARPFAGTTPTELGAEVVAGEVRPPPADSPVPPAVAAVVLRGLAREPGDRWPSVQAMLDALDAAVAAATPVEAPPAPPAPPARRRRAPIVVAGVALAAAAIAVPIVVARRGGDGPRTPAAAPPTTAPPAATADALPYGWLPPPSPTPPEWARWDVVKDQSQLDAKARAWSDDAAMNFLQVFAMKADGTVDLTAGGFVSYGYVSAKKGASNDPRDAGLCLFTTYIKDGQLYAQSASNTACGNEGIRATPPRRCAPTAIRERALADGADPAKPAMIQFLYLSPSAKAPIWLYEARGGFAKQYADDCS